MIVKNRRRQKPIKVPQPNTNIMKASKLNPMIESMMAFLYRMKAMGAPKRRLKMPSMAKSLSSACIFSSFPSVSLSFEPHCGQKLYVGSTLVPHLGQRLVLNHMYAQTLFGLRGSER